MATLAEIVELRKDGCSLASIGARFGVTRQAVTYRLKRMQKDSRPPA